MLVPLFTFLLIQTAGAESARAVQMDISGMTCVGCEKKVVSKLDGLAFLQHAEASTPAGKACAELIGELDTPALTAIITELGYSVTSIEEAEGCDLNEVALPQNWGQTDGLDVQIISRGEEVTLEEHVAQGKFTLFDFGAPWCGPCFAAEELLKVYLGDHPDVAVRAIVLDSRDAKKSFAMPATKQHLQSAAGLPYFILLNPEGKTVYRGTQVDKALKKMDKLR